MGRPSKFQKRVELLLQLIRNLSQPACYASTDWFCKQLGCSRRSYFRAQSYLLDKGLIFKNSICEFDYDWGKPHTYREITPAEPDVPTKPDHVQYTLPPEPPSPIDPNPLEDLKLSTEEIALIAVTDPVRAEIEERINHILDQKPQRDYQAQYRQWAQSEIKRFANHKE